MWHAKSIEISIQTTNKKPENICSKRIWWKCLQRATVLWFSWNILDRTSTCFPWRFTCMSTDPGHGCMSLAFKWGVSRCFFSHPEFSNICCKHSSNLLLTCQVACRSMQICRDCSPEPSWPCTSVLGYVWVQNLERKTCAIYIFVYIICFFSFTLSRSNLRFQWWPSLRQCLDGALPSEWRCETSNEATATRHLVGV